jgi:Xaa-Pro aminopeptidase
VSRLEHLQAQLELPLIVTTPVNVLYLTGLSSSNAAVVVESDRARLYTDFRYFERAQAVAGVEAIETPRDVLPALSNLLSGRFGFEADHVTYAGWQTLGSGGLELVATQGVVEALRAVKEPAELDAIRAAAAISDRAYEALAQERFTGRTERELAWTLDRLMHDFGSEGPGFETIVAAGENGSRPHAVPGDTPIEAGTLVTIDAGATVGGYRSDCTRTFATGELPGELARIYAICLEAELAGVAAVRAGITGVEGDAASRRVIEAAGYGERFGHGLGHGVGLLIHEAPAMRPESTETLVAGNIVTVEPGIYLPGVGGVRIEDLVTVTEGGCEILTRFTKDLVTVS